MFYCNDGHMISASENISLLHYIALCGIWWALSHDCLDCHFLGNDINICIIWQASQETACMIIINNDDDDDDDYFNDAVAAVAAAAAADDDDNDNNSKNDNNIFQVWSWKSQ